MSKFCSKMFLLALVVTFSFAIVGCGGDDKAALLTEKNVNTVLDELRASEEEVGYKIQDVDYGEKNGEHFCTALFDKAGRGSIYFTVTEKGSVIAAKISLTDTADFNLNYQANFVLVNFLLSAGVKQPEIEGFMKEFNTYLTAEIEKQNNTVNPTVDKTFNITSSKHNKNISIAVKGDDKERSYNVTIAQ